MENIVLQNPIASRIIFIRGQYVMLDKDIARLYMMETRVINQAVKRNPIKFPTRFVFQLTREETDSLASFINDCSMSQDVILKDDFISMSQDVQYPQSHCELHTFEKSHDRWLIIDNKVYHFGASLKDLGKRWFAFSMIEDITICQHILNSLKKFSSLAG